ncbi:beta-lactamase [Tenacibaculum holothuriorum]|uniref:Beta-lactamase n=1 Tax=Tenacibaculum holothuriorum TaxID=1635173 RepID=A0A1Y2PFT8_9FLAO|nr:serine hydrolase [Tenacibaculum holothuriorum]OSY89342.1 beta-lactamase [Tenacibaculum holothuriorum]
MKTILGKLLLMLLIVNNSFAQKYSAKEVETSINGLYPLELPKIRVVPIKDSKTARNYKLYIKLPADYSKNKNKTYPVLYYTDAMWHLEMLSGVTEYMLEDIILVGISWQLDINEDLKKERGDHVSRFRDYSMSEHSNSEVQNKYQFGQADKHLDFIRNDVIKYVDNTYRTNPNSRTYFGYSLGGEFGAYILMTQPETFNNYIIGSPTIKKEMKHLSELNTKFGSYKASNKNSSLKANVFITYGSLEDKTVSEPINTFVKLLNGRLDDGLSVIKEVIDGTHQTAFPMTAVKSVDWLSTLMTHVSKDNYEVSFWNTPHLNSPFITTTPENRKDGISVDTLVVKTNDRNRILNLSQEIFEGKYGHYDALLISHKDKLVFESYYKKGRINLPHMQASATKGYTSLIVGRAIQLGYLTMEDLDKPIVHFLKDLDSSKLVDGVEKITLRKALTMSSGLRFSNEQIADFRKNPKKYKGIKQVQAFLSLSNPITTTSQNYKYQGPDPIIVMQVLDAVVPGSAKDFIKNEFLDKLGINNYKWRDDLSGLPIADSRSSFTSRDMTKIGTLVLGKGQWNGKQLISSEYLSKATSAITKPTEDWQPKTFSYGYLWYQTTLKIKNKSYDIKITWGGGGQRIIVVKELDLIITITGHDSEDDKIMKPIFEIVIPAFD